MLEKRAARKKLVGFRATTREHRAIVRYAKKINQTVSDITRKLWKQHLKENQ